MQVQKYSDWKYGKNWFWNFIIDEYTPKTFFEKIRNFFWPREIDYRILSLNPNITWETVRDNPDKPWDYYCLSLNPNINMDIVRAYPKKEWEIPLIRSREAKISDLEQNNFRSWLSTCIVENPDYCIDIEYIVKTIKKESEWYHISSNPNITFDIVKKYPEKSWNYRELSINPGITLDHLESYYGHLDLNIFENPNISIDLYKRIKNIFWYDSVKIQSNLFLFDKTRYYREKRTDLNWRRKQFLKNYLPFSSYISEIISKRINYR